MLDEFLAATGYARKYAIRLLAQPVVPPGPIRRPRAPRYGPAVLDVLRNGAPRVFCWNDEAERLLPGWGLAAAAWAWVRL